MCNLSNEFVVSDTIEFDMFVDWLVVWLGLVRLGLASFGPILANALHTHIHTMYEPCMGLKRKVIWI